MVRGELRPSPLRALVLGGGHGRRLRVISRRFAGRPVPKQFCRFGGTRSLIQATLDRIFPLIPPHRIAVVVDVTQESWAETQLGGINGLDILLQPRDRGTAAGVLFPLAHVLEHWPEVTVLIAPSDHGIEDEGAFRHGVDAAHRAVDAGLADYVVFGVEPTAPNSDYGWILPESRLDAGLRRVGGFAEKPSSTKARTMFGDGGLWNTMIVVANGRALFDLYRRVLPEVTSAFEEWRRLPERARWDFLCRRYEEIPDSDFSRDILGAAPGLTVYAWPRTIGWTDLGTPDRMRAWLEENGRMERTRWSTMERAGAEEERWAST